MRVVNQSLVSSRLPPTQRNAQVLPERTQRALNQILSQMGAPWFPSHFGKQMP